MALKFKCEPPKVRARTEAKIEAYLELLRRGWTKRGAALRIGIGLGSIKRKKGRTKDWEALELEAYNTGTSFLEDTARKRAVQGKSDTLLIQLLKARDPHRFQPKQTIKHETEGGGPLVALLAELPEE